jgi:EmrB/QacA subfamily drug resistance transporter
MGAASSSVRSRVLILLCAADLLVMLDGMVVTVALPAIERDLGTGHADLQWVVTAYTLSLGAFLLVGGRAGDLYGRRRTLVVGLSLFALASLAAGLAPSVGPLLAARAVQGAGAALAVPAALALLTATYRQERERQRALGVLSATLDVGMVAGLVLGGVLTASLGWPWCFFIVVPFGLAAAALAPAVLEESRDEHALPRLDLAGAALAAGAAGMLVFALVRLEQDARAAMPFLAGGISLLVLFVIVERRAQAPLLRLAILRHRPLLGANLAMAANAGGFTGMTFLATLYLQQVLGFDAMQAGIAFLPLALSAAAGGLAAPRLIERAGPRRTACASLVATAAAFAFLSTLPDASGYLPVMLPAFIVSGFTFATAFVPLTAQAMTGIRAGERGLASGVLQTSTHLGGAIVLAVLATTAAATTAAQTGERQPTGDALTSGFALAFLVAAAILLLGALSAGRMLPGSNAAATTGGP